MRPIRVASVPASHVYVRHLGSPEFDDEVTRLPDPVPEDGRKVPGGWWPPLMLDPVWIRTNASNFDLFHIHFGFDAVNPKTLQDIVSELRDQGKPLVYTVHDLRNPHHPDPSMHDEQLDVLIPLADELITLTPGAARVIEGRWQRSATVLPHPHVVEKEWFAHHGASAAEPFTVGLHAKSFRANMDVLPVVEALTRAVSDLPGAELRVDLHDEVFDPDNHWYAPETGELLLKYGDRERVTVDVHPYYSDEQLFSYLSSLSVSVLPYRFGTHSGWLEACHDLGTQVIAPSCGFYHQQNPCETYTFDEERFDTASLQECVQRAYRKRWTSPRATWEERMSERRFLARAHRAIYERALG
ncbi:hypothetical protein A6410_00290 [Prescottella equi]|uniref:hypothetical protein n=1 Tax=Rhodococcus hoagii TaxID=43767 RepID=UPI0009C1228B|nr:hypothetical protein [Prescottella equi]OQQ32501.1 hypothetical protein A6410_00290 [Prescottella equi]